MFASKELRSPQFNPKLNVLSYIGVIVHIRTCVCIRSLRLGDRHGWQMLIQIYLHYFIISYLVPSQLCPFLYFFFSKLWAITSSPFSYSPYCSEYVIQKGVSLSVGPLIGFIYYFQPCLCFMQTVKFYQQIFLFYPLIVSLSYWFD